MSFINLQQAIDLIAKDSNQECNEFTLLHYLHSKDIKINAFIDNSKHKFHIARLTQYGFGFKDDDWLVTDIDTSYKGHLMIDADSNKEVITKIITSDETEVIAVKKEGSDDNYFLLGKDINSSMHPDVLEIFEKRDEIRIEKVVNQLGYGRNIKKDDLKFHLEQVENIGWKPIIKQYRNTDQRNLKDQIRRGIVKPTASALKKMSPHLTSDEIADYLSITFGAIVVAEKLNKKNMLNYDTLENSLFDEVENLKTGASKRTILKWMNEK